MSQYQPHGFNELRYAATNGSTGLAEKLVKKDPQLLFKATELNYLPIHKSLFAPHIETFGFLLQASKDHVDKCELKENHSPFEGLHGAMLLSVVIGAGLIEVAYELITANPGLCTTEYENVKPALMKIVENFDLYNSQPKKSRNLDHNIAKKLQAERRDSVDQRKLSSCFESEPLLDEVKEFPESEVKDNKPLLLLRSGCNKLRKKDTLVDTRYYFMYAATLSVRLDIKEALKEITTHFPDALIMKHEGYHLIEAAILCRSKKVIDFWVYEIPDDKYHILNLQTYEDENNLLHMAAMSAPLKEVEEIPNPALRMHKDILWFKKVENLVHPKYKEAKNKNGETPMMVFTREHEDLRKHAEKWIKTEAKSNMIIATCIIMIYFAVVYKFLNDNDSNSSIKTKILFGIWGVNICYTSSISSVSSLFIIISSFKEEDFQYKLPCKLKCGLIMLLLSLASMLVACGVLYLMFVGILPNIAVFTSIPVCWFALLKLKLLWKTLRCWNQR